MGFNDLFAFNLTMLDKQGWNFLTEPDSFVARIFKARYFSSHTYLTTPFDHNPIYVWRNILRARFIVFGGARWSVGSEFSISILNDPWLSNGECIDESIVELIFSVVRQVFSVDIAAKILNMPLIAQVQDDRLIWKAEKNGRYTVCGAYRLCIDELIDSSHLRRILGAIQHVIQSTTSTAETILLLLNMLSAKQNQQLVSDMVVERAKNLVDDWHLANASSIAAPAIQPQAHQPHGGEHSVASLDTTSSTAAAASNCCNRLLSVLTEPELAFVFRIVKVFVLAKVVSFPCIYPVCVGEAFGLHSAM
ncbi:hypothetical protein MTR_2g079840 [Medicago truncatula]|uniref:Uncharacterized protein n=1 Tax=Medicago truncatula TaxID=3880 RepID=A0A072VAZ9_MEDTR|nr:hypothetical protein MTR_2g079840 [Medicago truncatula]